MSLIDAGQLGPKQAPSVIPVRRTRRKVRRARILANARQLRDLLFEGKSVLERDNLPPRLFIHNSGLVEVKSANGRTRVVPVDEGLLAVELADAADFFRLRGNELSPCVPPRGLTRALISLPAEDWSIPHLTGVIQSPTLRQDGSLLSAPGFDSITGLYYVPSDEPLAIPDEPTSAQVGDAVKLVQEPMEDFPFANAASRAHTIAVMLTQAIRAAVAGPVPLVLLDAPAPGTGKSLLCTVMGTGRRVATMTWSPNLEEVRKAITSTLLDPPELVVVDNITAPIGKEAGPLCAAVTAGEWSDRQLGHNRLVRVPVRCMWILNANNLSATNEIARRAIGIRLDAQCARPYERTGFKLRLCEWLPRNSGRITAALVTIARGWFAAGQPAAQVRPLGSFEEWSRIIGGILEFAGIDGFLANQDELHTHADDESAVIEGFLLAIIDEFGEEPFLVADLARKLCAPDANPELLLVLPEKVANTLGDRGALQQALAYLFRDYAGRRFGASGVHLVKAGEKHHAALWRVSRGG